MVKNLIFHAALCLSVVIFTTCTNQNKKAIELAEKYFYPASASPYVLIFHDSLDPFYEMFERVVTHYDPWGEHRLIERYNANFVLIESCDILVDKNYKVHNHVLYSENREIVAQISDSTFMPWDGCGKFTSTFPGAVDTIIFTLSNKRSLNRENGSFEYEGKKLTTKIFTDSISTIAMDLKNKREKVQSAVAYHEFAEGIGRVRIRSADGKFNLVLQKVLSEDEWKRLITK
jgi:hypothetical protein